MSNMIRRLKLADDLFPDVAKGKKKVTIRNGKRDVALGWIRLETVSSGRAARVYVWKVVWKRLCDMTVAECKRDGFGNWIDALHGLKVFYPGINAESEVTYIEWDDADEIVLPKEMAA